MSEIQMCSPVSQAPSYIPNWQRAETLEDYLRNCREGLETFSDRRVAKLLGWSRVTVWRARLLAELSEELFERLLTQRPHSASVRRWPVSLALSRGEIYREVERCPHCDGVLRYRSPSSLSSDEILREWPRAAEPIKSGPANGG